MGDLKYKIKDYFFELGNEMSELGTNIWNKLRTKKWNIILLCIALFILGCYIWKPLLLLTITGAFMLLATLAVMAVPCMITVCCYILFHLSSINDAPKYPILNETLSIICSFVVFLITTYMSYDIAIRDMWYQPELWKEILNL